MKAKVVSIVMALALALALVSGCAKQETLTIFHAGSLTLPFKELSQEFNNLYPEVRVEREIAGSRTTIRKVTELGKPADIVASADYAAIEELMFPDFAEWYICFAGNKMVIAYGDSSKYKEEINRDNWYEILVRPGVEYGHADPDADPCGYRTLMVWQLAEEYYSQSGLSDNLKANCPKSNIRPKSVELLALLESGDLDYVFLYGSVAQQHQLNFLELPPEIDLSDMEFADFYARAKVEVKGKEPGTTTTLTGEPIVYALTIPKNAPNPDLAIAFIKFLLGKEGQLVMERNHQPPLVPAVANDVDRLPAELREYLKS